LRNSVMRGPTLHLVDPGEEPVVPRGELKIG